MVGAISLPTSDFIRKTLLVAVVSLKLQSCIAIWKQFWTLVLHFVIYSYYFDAQVMHLSSATGFMRWMHNILLKLEILYS